MGFFSSDTLGQLAYGLESAGVRPLKMNELSIQHHPAAAIVLATVLTTLALARISRWLETSGVATSFNESFSSGFRALFHALDALFRWSTLTTFFARKETDTKRDRRLLDQCVLRHRPAPRRSNSTHSRADPPRNLVGRFKTLWKNRAKDGSNTAAVPPTGWTREQRHAWESTTCRLYMDVLIRDHDSLEAEMASQAAETTALRARLAELALRVDQNHNWYCKVWNKYRPGDTVREAPLSMAKTALRQSDLWEAMYRDSIAELGARAEALEEALERAGEREAALARQVEDLGREADGHRVLAEELGCALERALAQVRGEAAARDDGVLGETVGDALGRAVGEGGKEVAMDGQGMSLELQPKSLGQSSSLEESLVELGTKSGDTTEVEGAGKEEGADVEEGAREEEGKQEEGAEEDELLISFM